MTPANDKQIGGAHYQTAYQPWDFIINNRLGFLEGYAIKYITRWRKKNGVQDLRKATHCIQKLREVATEDLVTPPPHVPTSQTVDFCLANKLTSAEAMLIAHIVSWKHPDDLLEAERDLAALLTTTTKEEDDGRPS